MRLVDVRSKQLVDRKIFDSSRTRYAILSHRWQDAELTLQDLARPDHASLPGYAKLSGACDLAAKKGYDYLWIDTCCIDKTSSAELSEAINSMFRWYEQSAVCYVYLTDVKAGGSVAPPPEVRASEWFKRGWTLQELLAPKTVEFYDADWQFIGTRTSLQKAISEASSIPRRFLSGESHIRSASVAQRMAWAATRQTTRLEDQAYSLMGLFDVNMPLLYGEGRKAFLRLQQEIMKNSSDQSLFAWGKMKTTIIDSEHWTIPELEVVTKTSGSYSGLLATTPARFTGWADRSLAATFGPESRIDLRQTSSGIQMRVPVIRGSQENVRIALLNCRNVDDDKHSVMGLLMARQHAAAEWHRARPVIAPAGGSDDPVYVVPWEIAQYAEYETIETLSTSTWHSALQFPTPNIDGTCGSITLQLADNLPERLHAVTPRGRFRKADHSVLPAFDHSGRWQEVTLFFGPKWSQDVEPKAERGFAVVMRPRSFSEAFWTLAWHSSPFINQVVTLPGEDYVRRFASLHVQSALHQSHGQYVLEIRPGTPPSLITSVYDAFFRTSPNYRTAIAIFLVQLYIHARTLGSETWSSHLVFLVGQIYFCCAAYWQNSWLSNRMQLGRLRLLAFRPMNVLQHLTSVGVCIPGPWLGLPNGYNADKGWPGVDDVLQRWVWLSSYCLAFLFLFKSRTALESMYQPGSAALRPLMLTGNHFAILATYVFCFSYFFVLRYIYPAANTVPHVKMLSVGIVVFWACWPVRAAQRVISQVDRTANLRRYLA